MRHPSVPRQGRARRVSFLGRLVLLSAVALVCAACSNRNSPSATAHPVLGEAKGTPLAVGQPAPTGTGELGAVSCATAERCWAVGVAGPNSSPTSPATVIVATKDGGLKWVPQGVHGSVIPELSGISCPTTRDCIAVGSNGASLSGSDVAYTTSDGGTDWSPVAAPPSGALDMTSVQCASVSDCTAIVNSGSQLTSAHTADLGQSWQLEGNLPAGFFGDGRLWCGTSGTCLVAGYVPTTAGHGQGAVAVSTDGGQSWTLATVPTGTGVLQSAACLTTTVCLAAGTTSSTVTEVVPAQGQLLHSADGGHTWTATVASTAATESATSTPSTASAASTTPTTAKAPAPGAALPVDDVSAVACPSTRVCALVGTSWSGQPAVPSGAVAESRDGGASFAKASSAYVPLGLSALTCPTTTECVTVGGDTVARLTLLPPLPAEKAPIRNSAGSRQ